MITTPENPVFRDVAHLSDVSVISAIHNTSENAIRNKQSFTTHLPSDATIGDLKHFVAGSFVSQIK